MKRVVYTAGMVLLYVLLFQQSPATGSVQPSLLMPLATHSLLLDLASAGENLVAVGERGHILLSDADGENWRQVPTPTREMLTAVYFADSQRGWAVGHDGLILASPDGGASWSVQYNGLLEQDSINQDQLQAVQRQKRQLEAELTRENDGHLRAGLVARLEEVHLAIEDAEYALSQPVHSSPLLDVYFSDPLRGFAIGAFGEYLYTVDGGVGWVRDTGAFENPEQMHLNAITGDGDALVWVAGEGGLLFRSVDGGTRWKALSSPYHGSFFDIAYEAATGALVVVGLRGNIYRSLDAGDSWQPASVDTARSLAGVTWLNERYTAAVGAVGNLQLSDDGANTFSDHSLPARTGLSSVIHHRGRLVVVGQGGIYSFRDLGDFSD
ncbi:MAG: YCF48-related protein [Halieaceae bacterium]